MKPSTFALPLLLTAALATATAAHAQTTPSAAGGDYALLCNGATDFLVADKLPQVSNTFTMEAWVNPTATHEIDAENISGIAGFRGEHYVVYPLHGTACWGVGHAGAGFSVGTNGVTVYEHAADYMPATLVYEGKIEGWTHIAVVYNDRLPSLYINGKFVKSGVRGSMAQVHPSAGKASDARYIYGGIGGGPLGYFAGTIDNVRIWNRALGAERVAATMRNGDGEGLVMSFTMDRTGQGSGLTLQEGGTLAPANRAGSYATTVGTAATPVFTPRARTLSPMPARIDAAPAQIAAPAPAIKADREPQDDSRPTIE